MNVHLAIPDLFWPAGRARPDADPGRFTALEQLFARGRRTHGSAAGLDAWLLDAWQASGGAAAYSLLADGGEPGEAYWAHADPCHLRVSRDHALLVDATMFDLSRAEAEALAETINRHFADRGIVCYPMQPERWYLRVDGTARFDAPALALARGKPVSTHARVAHSHALANELQMLLHEHPVNVAREAHGDEPVNAVWLWGGGRFAAPARAPFRRVRTHAPLAAGLARASNAAVLPTPDTGGQWLRAAADEGVELIVLDALSAPASYGDHAAWRERLVRLEHDWFAPLLDALRRGRIGMLTLHAIGADGSVDVETTRQDLRYFWRRTKPIPEYARQ